ncbi:alpha/beta fold hydrolase [Kitasatospora sp. NPDC059571]|uniref:alpha/beta fold hydrolase n=1 Tax=Kitasatospora sp. NPDC059571 TaxID=3346871 RepID=UPI0036821CF0
MVNKPFDRVFGESRSPSLRSRSAAGVRAGTGAESLPPRRATAFSGVSGIADLAPRQVRVGPLSMGYIEAGPTAAPVALLLHGWPYGIHSFADVVPLLTAQGFRVVVPYLRGHGTTRFVSAETFRNGQQTAVALDIVALMDALGIGSAVLGGFGWGAQTAQTIAVLWPERSRALVSAAGHPDTADGGGALPLPPTSQWAWWSRHYRSLAAAWPGPERHGVIRSMWKDLSPGWDFDDATFETASPAFGNPDWARIAVHSHQWQLGQADGDPRLDGLEARVAADPTIAVPTIALDAELDPSRPAGGPAAYWDRFIGKLGHRTLMGIGHNIPQESPAAFAQAVVDAHRL